MNSSYFFHSIDENDETERFLTPLKKFAEENKTSIFVIKKALGNDDFKYEISKVCVVLVPKCKLMFLNYGNERKDLFDSYVDDFVEDLGYLSKKYKYEEVLGRPRNWSDIFYTKISFSSANDLFYGIENAKLENPLDVKKANLMISLLSGSINDISKVKANAPETLLDKVKQKIILFDGDQTRFIYGKNSKKIIRIQGLSGTGKTELLLHKIKDVFAKNDESRILLTCHNKILAHELKRRLPKFFDFMKVDRQINENLMCMHSWGSSLEKGTYRYICERYNLPFYPYKKGVSFDVICGIALTQIQKLKRNVSEFEHCFDWCFIDESQDFGENFINLCNEVTKNQVYASGDIFQSIFDNFKSSDIQPDYLLSKCYRTDPRTLMVAHGLGMGLFEEKKLWWLDDDQWNSCGYTYTKEDENRTYVFQREPLMRFEDVPADYKSFQIFSVNKRLESLEKIDKFIIDQIKKLKEENSTLTPSDVCVILIDGDDESYQMMERLKYKIPVELEGWKANKAHETKDKEDNSLLIANRNNVKGLEFPFVICVTSQISSSYSYRNALYTMLTRSFLQSILVVTTPVPDDIRENITKALESIEKHQCMRVTAPTDIEKNDIRVRFNSSKMALSLYDAFKNICERYDIKNYKDREKLLESYKKLVEDEDVIDETRIEEFIESNARFILKRK